MTEEQKKHYFDWASTSPTDKKIVQNAFERTIDTWGNPSSIHSAGKEAKLLLDEARKTCAEVLDVEEDTIYWTSGGTESDHIPLLSVLNKNSKGTILFSSIEHPAVREMANELKKCGWNPVSIPSNKDGIVTADAVMEKLTPDTAIVFIMAVNNETGAIQPIREIADAINQFAGNKRRPKLHVDCVQAAGKIPLDFLKHGVDSAAFSAHKICGPRGIGLLYLKDKIEPFLKGGGQEKGIRSGTENIFGCLAMAMVLKKHATKSEENLKRFQLQMQFTSNFCKKLSQINGATIIPEARLQNPQNYSPWIVQASFKNIPGQVMLRALDSEGFYISTGSACSSRKNSRPILDAMHVSKNISENAVRFSFGPDTTEEAMDELLLKVQQICGKFN